MSESRGVDMVDRDMEEAYWDLEARWWALEARRHGSAYRKSLRLSWWKRLLMEFTPLP